MRLYSVIAVLALITHTLAWTKEDHEIFRIRDELALLEGEDVSFYDFLGVTRSATLDDLKKQYRKRSLQLHPDKAVPSLLAKRSMPSSSPKPKDKSKKKPGVNVTKGPTAKERAQITKEATERYALLGTVATILRGAERDRYDHFLSNGFPRWRGSGYYYARLRPGLGSVVIGLFIVFGGAAHYGALYVGWKRQREFVQRYVSHARNAAWGNDAGIPGVPGATLGTPVPAQSMQQDEDGGAAMPLNRRQKRMQEKESKKKDTTRVAKSARANGIGKPMDPEPIAAPQGTKKKVVAPNGKVLIVDSVGNVFLEETSAEGEMNEFLLDVSLPDTLLNNLHH